MPKRRPPPEIQEVISTLRFPLGGIDLTQKPSGQRPGTTAVGVNVRACEALTQRLRGGSRAGIRRYIDEQVAGDHYIQHLNYIVTASAEALGASFDGVDLGDIGSLGVDNFGGLDGNPFAGWGGGGYQPALPRAALRVTMEILSITPSLQAGESASILPVAPPHKTASLPARAGNSAVVRATLRDFSGTAQAGDSITLHTSPPGRPGDGATGVTVLDVSDPPLGTVDFTVTDTNVETVTYTASDTTNPTDSVNSVKITWKQPVAAPPTTGGDDAMGHCRGLDVTVTVENIEIAAGGGIVSDTTSTLATFSVLSPYNLGGSPALAGNNGPVPGFLTLGASTWRVTPSGSTLVLKAFGGPDLVEDFSQALASPPHCPLNVNDFDSGAFWIRSAPTLSGGIAQQRVFMSGVSHF